MISEESKALSRHGPYKRTASSHCLYKSMLSTHKQLFSLYLSYKVLVSPSSPPSPSKEIQFPSCIFPGLNWTINQTCSLTCLRTNQTNSTLLFLYWIWTTIEPPLNHHCGPFHLFWILESSLHKNVDRNSHTFLRILKCSVVNSPLYVHNLVEVDSEFLGKIC